MQPHMREISPWTSLRRLGNQVLLYPRGDRFNLSSLNEHDDVLFFFEARFNERKIVLNARINGKWYEPYGDKLPLGKGYQSHLRIWNNPQNIQVYIQGQREPFIIFTHAPGVRPAKDYIKWRVEGDVEVSFFGFER
ncbi:GLT [Parelaphostrongylus tenuis]|uniref:Galectin n=1 Tax=Parelaphostrongylus tenuis TaxID=148309 RepID=A0AAD5QQR3_PARTN|nr:GLT [Parelaphostrongylus tenuis]